VSRKGGANLYTKGIASQEQETTGLEKTGPEHEERDDAYL